MGKHSKSPSKTKGANLTLKQKEDFRNAVMAEFPDIAKNDEYMELIDIMIEKYSSEDRKLGEKLADLVKDYDPTKDDLPDNVPQIAVYKPEDEEYKRVMKAMEDARREHEEKIKAGYEEEQRLKNKSIESNIDEAVIID